MADNIKSNFYKLIQSKSIIIPIIQRDYVQGKTTSKINGIREELIFDMLQALKNGNKIDFQYIYGIYKEGDCYLPIDGQQRLTSMFLFTWGVSILAGEESSKKWASLKKFSYQVREVSKDFFRCLLEYDDSNQLMHFYDFKSFMEDPNKHFDDFSWFKGKWQNDQTVRSSLVFLDCLRKELKKSCDNNDYQKFLDTILCDECPFEFFLIAQNEVTDNSNKTEMEKQNEAFEAENRAATTYINMNARGKALNEFENFKALLHKCEYSDKNKYAGKQFIGAYEGDYIHSLVKYIEHYDNKNLSLSEKIEKMDGFTLNFLMNIYNDIYKIKQTGDVEQKDIYRFMYFIKEKKCICEDIFDEDYFDFIKYVMENSKPDKNSGNMEFDDVFYYYCNTHTYRERWNFMLKYWAGYRLKKIGIAFDGWKIFCDHLDISIDDGSKGIASKWCQNATNDKRYILNKILDQLYNSGKSSVEEFLKDIDIKTFLNNICGNSDGNDSLNLVYARLLEEKIKANIYIREKNNNQDCKEILNTEKQLRYLLYMAEYYDLNGNYNGNYNGNENERYECFKKYLNLHNQVKEQLNQPSIQWRKVYYISAINDLQEKPEPPSDNIQCWREEIRFWKGESIPRAELNRTKKIFDDLINNNKTLDDMVTDYQNKYCDISCWLYYLLRRGMTEIINGQITVNNSKYSYSNRDYYEYVLEKDLITKGYSVANKDMKEKIKTTAQISPRQGKDEQTRNRNPEFKISPYFENIDNNTIINQNTWYRFKFYEFDSQNKNEDRFEWWEDQNFYATILAAYNQVISAVGSTIDSLSEDEMCDLIYQKKTSTLEEKLNTLNLNPGWSIDYVVNDGANGVKIRIKCTETPFTNLQPKYKNHSKIIEGEI